MPVKMPLNMAVVFFIFKSNVRGQRTRHLVEGTLDPLVGKLLSNGLLIPVPIGHLIYDKLDDSLTLLYRRTPLCGFQMG